jgi:hypothetical protein
MRSRHGVSCFVLVLFSFLFSTSAFGSAPVISKRNPGPEAGLREMDIGRMSVTASNPLGGPMTYTWRIDDPQGTAAQLKAGTNVCELHVYWTNPVAGGHNGKQVVVSLDVSNGVETTTVHWTWTIRGVNQPPMPIIEGILGTPSAPLISGTAIAPNGNKSYDPDGDFLDFQFTIPSIDSLSNLCPGAVVQPFGMNGPTPTIPIPPMRTPTTFLIRLTLKDGLHAATRDVLAYTAPGPDGCGTTTPPPPPPDQLTVSAGSDRTVGYGQTVTLQASANKTGVTYSWAQIGTTGGNLVQLTGANTSQVSFTTPNNTTSLRFEVTGSDGTSTAKSQVTVYVVESGSTQPPPSTGCSGGNQAPVVNAPANTVVNSGELVTLQGSGYDPDNTTTVVGGVVISGVSFQWTVMSDAGLSINLQNASSAIVNFVAPSVSVDTTVVLKLQVSDPLGCSSYALSNVLIKGATNYEGRTAKIRYSLGEGFVDATPGAVIEFAAPKEVSLVGQSTGFTSPRYSWSKPAGSVGTLPSTGSSVKYNVGYFSSSTVVDVAVTLTVTEATNAAKTAPPVTITFRITPPPQSPPQAAISRENLAYSVETGSWVVVEGAATSGGGGMTGDFRYIWKIKCPDGQSVEVFSNGKKAMFKAPPVQGAEEMAIDVELIVNEGDVPSAPDKVNLVVRAPVLLFPQIGAGGASGDPFEVETILALVNDSEDDIVGATVDFFASDGGPLNLIVGGEVKSSETFDLPAGSARQIVLTSDELLVGWARVLSPVRIAGIAVYRYVDRATGDTIAETGLFSSPVSSRFRTVARPGKNEDLALAIANTSSQKAVVRIVLREENSTRDFVAEFELEANQHKARLLAEIFGLDEIPADFAGGTLAVEVSEGTADLIATILKFRGLNLSTVPLASRSR